MLRNVGRAVIVKGGKDSSLDCALFNTYRRSKEPSATHNVQPHKGSGMRQQPGSGETLMRGCHGSSRTNQKSLDIGMRDLMTIVIYF